MFLTKGTDMAFSSVPKETKGQINKAGHVLSTLGESSSYQLGEFERALDLANRWRACHAYPINTFQATLRKKMQCFPKESIVAQRLKRMTTIIDKLKRYPQMNLTDMQDIGGIRAILPTVTDVYTLVDNYKNNSKLRHKLVNEKDYIGKPRQNDGYRCYHLIYKYYNIKNQKYDGLKLELQIRSKLQHVWATAVETMSTFLGQALKSRQGDQEWLDFFAIISSAFSFLEKTPQIPKYNNLNKQQTFQKVMELEAALGALDKMKAFSVAVNEIVKRKKGEGNKYFYHLIVLNSLEKKVQVRAYDRNSFKEAMKDYSSVENEASKPNNKIEPVLVAAGPIDSLRRAYPNFFLDISDFVKYVSSIIAQAKHKIERSEALKAKKQNSIPIS
jgi:ppGpp synthetase/RelA/SpoT-type nucleotidyltranferase